ncbi:hypothetical protein MGI18_02185 [Bacillus sp. OVS6]|nr:hypothetical protein MGI18_02185 [Bacillus sp. OVS6]
MMRQCRGILLFEVLDIRNSLTIFWTILISCMALSFGIQLSTGGNLTVSSGIAVYIFSAIAGFLTVKETYPFSIKMGSTRKIIMQPRVSFSFCLLYLWRLRILF